MKRYGFVQSLADYSLFTYNNGKIFIGVLVYVDDMIIVSNDNTASTNFKKFLDTNFGIKDLGKLKYFLGIEVAHGKKGLFLNQRKYALGIIEEAGMNGAKPAYTPMETDHKLELANGYLLKHAMKYRRLVGRLVYLTIRQPDLVYIRCPHTVTFCEQSEKRVVRYIKSNQVKALS